MYRNIYIYIYSTAILYIFVASLHMVLCIMFGVDTSGSGPADFPGRLGISCFLRPAR